MDENQKKEQFSRAYVKAVCAQAGLNTSEPAVDHDSVDLIVQARGLETKIRNPQIEAQLKCTKRDTGSEGSFHFQLSKKNYDDLRGLNVFSPRYLFVLVVPEEPHEWLTCDPSVSEIRYCCYWYSLRGASESRNRRNVSIEIPRSQILTAESLKELLQQAGDRRAA